MLETKNPNHGFFGTMASFALRTGEDGDFPFWHYVGHAKSEWFNAMSLIVMNNLLPEISAQQFLDSRMGRHLADALVDHRVKQDNRDLQITHVRTGGTLRGYITWWLKEQDKEEQACQETPKIHIEISLPKSCGECLFKTGAKEGRLAESNHDEPQNFQTAGITTKEHAQQHGSYVLRKLTDKAFKNIPEHVFNEFLRSISAHVHTAGKKKADTPVCPDCLKDVDLCTCNQPVCQYGHTFGEPDAPMNVYCGFCHTRERCLEYERRKNKKEIWGIYV